MAVAGSLEPGAFTGGGGTELYPWLRVVLPGVVLGEDPLFANALGYLSGMAGGAR